MSDFVPSVLYKWQQCAPMTFSCAKSVQGESNGKINFDIAEPQPDLTKKSWHEAALRQGHAALSSKNFSEKMFVPRHFFQAARVKIFWAFPCPYEPKLHALIRT